MRSLALLLLLANIIFLWWQLSWLPWLPWQPSQFINNMPSEESPVSDLPQLVLLKESNLNKAVVSVSASDKMGTGPVSTSSTTKSGAITPAEAVKVKAVDEKNTVAEENEEPAKAGDLAPAESVKIKVGDENQAVAENEEPVAVKIVTAYNNDANVIEKSKQVETGNKNGDDKKVLTRQEVDREKNEEKAPTDSTRGATHTAKALLTPPPSKTLENISKAKSSPLAEQFKSAPVVQAPVKNSSSVTCFKAGPYVPLADAKKLADWLKSQAQVSVEVQNRETPVSTKTWVYLPPLGNRQAALRVVQRLSQQGVTGQGIESNNAISLGIFKNKDNAARRVKELQAKGYDEVKTEEHHENETRYWLNVKIAGNPKSVLNAFEKRFKESPALEAETCESEK